VIIDAAFEQIFPKRVTFNNATSIPHQYFALSRPKTTP